MGFRRLRLLVLGLLLVPTTTVFAEDPPTASDSTPSETTQAVAAARVAPVDLKIPVLGVDADIVPVGETEDGAMDVPPTPDSVAWWSLGWGTGENGNVVLAAHVDWGGQLRVFGRLHTLTPGDQVYVVDEQLREFKYEVVSSHWVDAEGAPIEEIFGSSGESELTLITCGGTFDRASRQYLQRLIVKARQV